METYLFFRFPDNSSSRRITRTTKAPCVRGWTRIWSFCLLWSWFCLYLSHVIHILLTWKEMQNENERTANCFYWKAESRIHHLCRQGWLSKYESHAYAPQDRWQLLLFHYQHIFYACQPISTKWKSKHLFFNKGRFRYEGIMLVGTMEVLEDAKTKQDIWRPGDSMFYKKGVTDPDYCVLRFTAIKGRHYCDLKTESFDF